MVFCILSYGNYAFEIDTCFCDTSFASMEVTEYDGLACPITIYTHAYIYAKI